MRILIQQYPLIFSTLLVAFLLLPQSVRADGGEEYYKELRKLKKYDPATLRKLKKETIDAETMKKVNAESKANFKHNAEVEARSKKGPAIPKDLKAMYPPPATGPNGEKAGPPRYSDAPPTKAKSSSSASKSTSAPPPETKKVNPRKESSSTPSGPIKVDHQSPDEITFPGTEE